MDDVLSTRPAGFWIRAVAFGIDAVVCLLVQASLSALGRGLLGAGGDDATAEPTAFFFTVIFAAAYWTTLHMVAGQTLGKSIVGVRVVGIDGALLTFGPAFLRYLASGLSLAIFGFGFLMAGLRRDKRALHDLIAGSRVDRLIPRPVVRRVARPAPVAPAEPAEPSVTPVESSLKSGESSLTSVESSLTPAESSRTPVESSLPPVESSRTPVTSPVVPSPPSPTRSVEPPPASTP
jgi:uncharacterized RDD family membrane protein YckC